MDIVYIHGLRADAVIGVHDWEKQVRQTLVIDLDMARDIRAAAASDDLADALDYSAVAACVRELVENNRAELIETLAEIIASTLMREFSLPWLRLRLGKPGAVPDSRDVGILIERGAQ